MGDVPTESVQAVIASFPEFFPTFKLNGKLIFDSKDAWVKNRNIIILGLATTAGNLWGALFKEVYRVLKKDGVFLFNVAAPKMSGPFVATQVEAYGRPDIRIVFPYLIAESIIMSIPEFILQADFTIVKIVSDDIKDIINKSDMMAMVDQEYVERMFLFTKIKENFKGVYNTGIVLGAPIPRPIDSTGEPLPLPFNELWLSYLIGVFTEPDDIILDPVAGTGTIIKVADKFGRKGIAYEINPKMVGPAREKLSGLDVEFIL